MKQTSVLKELLFKDVSFVVFSANTFLKTDWFITCHRSEGKWVSKPVSGVSLTAPRSAGGQGDELFHFEMSKQDVHEFFYLYSEGLLVKKHSSPLGEAYEPSGKDIKNFISKLPIKKRKKKKK